VVDCPFAAAKKALRYLVRRVLQLEKEIDELLVDLDQLTQQACPGLRKPYGIAVDGALMLPLPLSALLATCQRVRVEPMGFDSIEDATARPMSPSIA